MEMSLGKECLEIMKRLFLGELNQSQYCDALLALHIKYPMNGHNPPLTEYQLKNYRKIPKITQHPDNKNIKYLDHLQPLNFDEAAQMYYWQTKDKQDRLKPEKKSWQVRGDI
jgi:hypothetical protein